MLGSGLHELVRSREFDILLVQGRRRILPTEASVSAEYIFHLARKEL